ITEIKDLIDYAMSERFDDWFPLLCDNSAYIIGQYIKSNRHGGSVNSKINKG
ncbi:replication protein, partial [Enterococcus faecium E1636]